MTASFTNLTTFGIFSTLLSTYNVNLARFARNVEWDFFSVIFSLGIETVMFCPLTAILGTIHKAQSLVFDTSKHTQKGCVLQASPRGFLEKVFYKVTEPQANWRYCFKVTGHKKIIILLYPIFKNFKNLTLFLRNKDNFGDFQT